MVVGPEGHLLLNTSNISVGVTVFSTRARSHAISGGLALIAFGESFLSGSEAAAFLPQESTPVYIHKISFCLIMQAFNLP